MSIANLFSPNDYDLFCKSITTSGLAPIDTNIIDTVNIGDTLQIGPVKAGAITISHAGTTTTFADTANGTRFNAPNFGTATAVAMLVGASSSSLTLTTTNNINIDKAAPLGLLNTLSLGVTNMGSVNIGRVGGTVTANPGITFPGGGAITYYEDMAQISATGGGCIPATANFILFNAHRQNNVVILRWRPNSANILATALSVLSITQVLPANFRPIATVRYACGIVGGAGPTYPGVLTITTGGIMQFEFMASTHAGTITWAIGETCNVGTDSVTYSII